MDELRYEGENYTELITFKYGEDIKKLARYIPYFENKRGRDVASEYDGEQGESNLRFPVYDSTLLAFTNEAGQTKLMDHNYIYKYRLYRIMTEKQEQDAVANAKLKDLDLLIAILSRYVLEGRYKSQRWIEGAERGIFHDVLKKLMELYDFVQVDHTL